MAIAIRKVTLEPFFVKATDQNILRAAIYAYMNIGVPILMSMNICDCSGPTAKYVDRHAVAITGFSLIDSTPPTPMGATNFLLNSTKINEIYVHDDQVGPFAKMILHSGIVNVKIDGVDQHFDTLSVEGGGGNIKAIPDTLLIPLYHKIRITFDSIQGVVSYVDSFLEVMRGSGAFSLPSRLEWDIRLIETNKLKEIIFASSLLDTTEKWKTLLANLPRFVWRATASCDNTSQLDLLFDATDIEQGFYLTRAIQYNKDIFTCLLNSSKDPATKTQPIWKVLKWFSTI